MASQDIAAHRREASLKELTLACGVSFSKNAVAIPCFSSNLIELAACARSRFLFTNVPGTCQLPLSGYAPWSIGHGTMEDFQEHAEQIFVTALGLDPNKRAAYLQNVCGSSPELKARVEKMLQDDELAGSFLERPLFDHLSPHVIRDKQIPSQDADARPGDAAGTLQYNPQFNSGDILFDRFQVVRFIARGGMGEVYEVKDRQLRGVHVALKTILSQYAADPLMKERFEREVLNAREVVHPNLCPIYDIFHWNRPEGRLTFLTMKLLAGETLAARLARAGPIPAPEASPIIRQVGAGLSAAHDAGILHRDIKAANIMLDGSGGEVYACVTDFGLARGALAETTSLTVGGVAGTPGYMAPELYYGGTPSKTSDVFSFGVVVYQVLTGHLPRLTLNHNSDSIIAALTHNLPLPWRQLLRGCLEPNPDLRLKDIPSALQLLAQTPIEDNDSLHHSSFLTRRKMIALTASGCVAVAGAAWLERDKLIDWFEPLPSKRFVALMAWPPGESQSVVLTILDSIGNRLARAEAYVKDLLVVSARDVPFAGTPLSAPNKSESSLGANLVLAASAQQKSSQVHLQLQLLEASSQRVLRKSIISCAAAEISNLTQQAAERAALLLRIPPQEIQVKDVEESRNLPPDVFQAYSEAEELMGEPNHSGLQKAIGKYQHALDLDPHFALGYAKIARAYIAQYFVTSEPANIDLAQRNAANALRYNPHSAMGLLSQALALLYTGKAAEALTVFAKALQADPGNPEVLLYKARAFEDQGKNYIEDAEQVYREIVADRPNYWPAYNNLGVLLARNGKYNDAAKAFASAGMAAPDVALPMANLGTTYIQLGRREDARAALTESLKRGENEDVYLALGDIDFEDGKFNDALKAYQQAGKLAPKYHLVQRNIGDCYAMLGNLQLELASYREAARLLSSSLQTNPENGFSWANLAFYHAKTGDPTAAEIDIRNAEAHGATDLASQFMITQALAVMGRKKEALSRLEWCLDCNLSSADLDLALDLKDLRKDPAFLSYLKSRGTGKTSSFNCKSKPS
jgi:serine/threonine protein kinase/Tfp pilus assembly protein PilF